MKTVLPVLDAVINTIWQAVLITAIVWLVLRLTPRINAATRHAIWWATLAVVLLLPAAPALRSMLRTNRDIPRISTAPKVPPAPPIAPEEPILLHVSPERTAIWPRILLAIWAAILLWRFGQIVRSYFYLRAVKRRAAVSNFELPAISRSARLLISRDIVSPMAVGFLHPAIILPEAMLPELSPTEREHVLLHESAHLAGYDDWTNLAMRLLGGTLALHPIAIWILRQIEREREIACDDWVVAKTGEPRTYAESLAHLVDLRHAQKAPVLASGFFGGGSRVGARIELLVRRGRQFSGRASRRSAALSALALCVLGLATSFAPRWIAFAQASPAEQFEVASIKPGDPNSRDVSIMMQPGGKFQATNASLQMLVGFAFDIRNHQIAGLPSQLETAKFNIEGRSAGPVSGPPGPERAKRARLMLQSLLTERFKLQTHHETRQQQIYELVTDKGGPKIRESTGNLQARQQGLRMSRGELIGTAAPLQLLVNQLSQQLWRAVVDKTGLSSKYDFTLKWTPDSKAFAPGEAADEPDSAASSIFTAVREQLGLKLVSAKGPVDVVVIDHVEMPDAN
jgi:uncharacterized protein (TIGR03435 family)